MILRNNGAVLLLVISKVHGPQIFYHLSHFERLVNHMLGTSFPVRLNVQTTTSKISLRRRIRFSIECRVKAIIRQHGCAV